MIKKISHHIYREIAQNSELRNGVSDENLQNVSLHHETAQHARSTYVPILPVQAQTTMRAIEREKKHAITQTTIK